MISAVKLYERLNINGKLHSPMPATSNLEGEYRGELLVDFTLLKLIRTYREAEIKGDIHEIYDTKNWVVLSEISKYTHEDDEEAKETLEYGILKCYAMGYIDLDFFDVRHFKLTEKCMNLELYRLP
ncbi:hypothetical protein [Salipaludibacillus sp. CF4.18]|uniref:hypothetical protein n=1 Tax=Salipaludibacillus sp. CF4.18 TaxID=3373081 RepID=UPI003EE6478D